MLKDMSSLLINFLLRPQMNVITLWVGIFTFSTVPLVVNVPETYFSEKKNIINQWYVKQCWLWTLLITGPYMILTAFVYGGDSSRKTVFRAVLRLLCGTVIWFVWTLQAFPFVENITGVCLKQNNHPDFTINDKWDCKKIGGHWNAFDISGHSFLLTYIILFISSEIKIHRHWYKIPTKASLLLQIGSKSLILVKQRYSRTLGIVRLFFMLNVVMILVSYVMLIATCLYFHSFLDKPLAAGCAVMSWMATYNEWYKNKFSPGLPGSQSVICSMEIEQSCFVPSTLSSKQQNSHEQRSNSYALVPYQANMLLSEFYKPSKSFDFNNLEQSIDVLQEYDSYGVAGVVWEGATVLCEYITSHANEWKNKRVLELGAGTGLAGIVAAKIGSQSVTLTDQERNLEILRQNIKLNFADGEVVKPRVEKLEWNVNLDDFSSSDYDIVIGADVIYNVDMFRNLLKTMRHLSGEGCQVILSSKLRYDRVEQFNKIAARHFSLELLYFDHDSNVAIYRFTKYTST